MNIIRIIFGLVGTAWLLGMLAFGLGTSWLTHDPDAAAGVALGAMAVDGDAGVMDNARGFAGGYTAGRSLSENMRSSAARSELRQSCEEQENGDWGAPEYCHELEQADRETYERISNDW